MNAEQIQALQQEFGLRYHIEYASLAQQSVGFRNKRVLEVGGSLPKRLVLEVLEAAQWTALEEMDYWAEALSTGNVQGTPPVLTGNKKRFIDVVPTDLESCNLFYGRIEELSTQLERQFDLVFSIAAFEHIARLPQALEKNETRPCSRRKAVYIVCAGLVMLQRTSFAGDRRRRRKSLELW